MKPVPQVTSVRNMAWLNPVPSVTPATIALEDRTLHSRPSMAAARATSANEEAGMRRDARLVTTSLTGRWIRVMTVLQGPTARHLVSCRVYILKFCLMKYEI